MVDSSNPVTVLEESRCWDLLASQEVGRLATAVQGFPEIFPVNFVVDGESIVFRTAEQEHVVSVERLAESSGSEASADDAAEGNAGEGGPTDSPGDAT